VLRAGPSWARLSNGLPQKDAHLGVLREGMATGAHDDFGLYFGTSTRPALRLNDEGNSWTEIASYLPSITSVETGVVDA
jgi:hypothetical protein